MERRDQAAAVSRLKAPSVKVVVSGVLGRMGQSVARAIGNSGDLQLAGGFDRAQSGKPLREFLGLAQDAGRVYDDVADLYDAVKPDVVVDFSLYPATVTVAREAVDRGISPVIGTTGWTEEDILSFADLCDENGVGAMLVPNFAIGAVLMMRFSAIAARFFPTSEIVEYHHDQKIDKPSGTAKLTADRIAQASGRPSVPIHSVRLRGMLAHQEVLFGGTGEVLTIRHDSLARNSFDTGVLMAVRHVRKLSTLQIGLDGLIDQLLAEPAHTPEPELTQRR